MKPIPPESRVRNVHGKERCRYCVNEGLVVVATRPSDNPESPFEEYGPCPFCQVGLEREHALYPEGFWQGRDPVALEPLETEHGSKPLPPAENARRMRELTANIGRVGRPL